MAIWDDITKKAAALGEKAVKQAKDLSEVAKLKLQIAEAERTVEDTYTQLGRLYAATHPEDYEEGFASLMATVANAEQTIKTLRDQLHDAKGVAVCEKCGAELPKPTPVEAEVVTEEAPAEEAPVEEAPAEEAPVEEAPAAEEAPVETAE